MSLEFHFVGDGVFTCVVETGGHYLLASRGGQVASFSREPYLSKLEVPGENLKPGDVSVYVIPRDPRAETLQDATRQGEKIPFFAELGFTREDLTAERTGAFNLCLTDGSKNAHLSRYQLRLAKAVMTAFHATEFGHNFRERWAITARQWEPKQA